MHKEVRSLRPHPLVALLIAACLLTRVDGHSPLASATDSVPEGNVLVAQHARVRALTVVLWLALCKSPAVPAVAPLRFPLGLSVGIVQRQLNLQAALQACLIR